MRPESAKPMAVEPKLEIDMSEFAAASSSSLAISGRTLSLAGSKNWVTTEESATNRYSQPMPRSAKSLRTTKGMTKTMTPRTRSELTMIALRGQRSTKTPATRPTSRLGAAVAMSMRPTESAEPVSR